MEGRVEVKGTSFERVFATRHESQYSRKGGEDLVRADNGSRTMLAAADERKGLTKKL